MLSRGMGCAGGLLLAAGLLGAAPPPAEEVCPFATPTEAPPSSPLVAEPEELHLPGEVSPVKPPSKPAPQTPAATGPKKATDPDNAPNRPGRVDLLTAPPVPERWGPSFGTRPVPAKRVSPPPQSAAPFGAPYETQSRPAPAKPLPPVQPAAPRPVVPSGNAPAVPAPALFPAPSAADESPSRTATQVAPLPAPLPKSVRETTAEKKLDLPPGMPPPLYPSRKWPPAFDVRSPSGAYVNTGQVVFEEPPTPGQLPKPPAPPPTPKPARAPSPAPYLREPPPPPPIIADWPSARPPSPSKGSVTTGTMFFEETPPSPGKAPVPPAAPLPAARTGSVPVAADAGMLRAWELKRRVRAACGSLAQEVLVVQKPDQTLLVTVRVDDAATEKKALDAISRLPEMADPQVHLQVNRAQ
jgi:hypothetical protein